jgi:hypothetical protein
MPPLSPKDWAARINVAWRRTAESIIETGQLLLQCKAEMPGHFMKIVRNHLDFGLDTAERLMAIARHPVLADSAVLRTLPRSYVTLATLAKLPEERVRALIEDRTITPEMRGREAEALLPKVQHQTVVTATPADDVSVPAYVSKPVPLMEARHPPLPIQQKEPAPPSLPARSVWTKPVPKGQSVVSLSSVPSWNETRKDPMPLPPPKPRFRRDRSITHETILRTIDRVIADADAEGEALDVAVARDLAEFGDGLAKRALTLQGFAPDADDEEGEP